MTGAFAELHPDRFETDAAPADVGGADGDGHEQVVDLVREDRAIRHLCGAGLLGDEEDAVDVAAGNAAGQTRDGVHRPVGHGDAVGVDRRAGDALGDEIVLLLEDVAADETAGLADIDLVGDVVVVAKLVRREAIAGERFALACGRLGIVLQPPQPHQHGVEVLLGDGLAGGPVGTGIPVLRADEPPAIPGDLAVGQVGHESAAGGGFGERRIVVRGLFNHDPVHRLAGEDEPVVVGHHGIVGLTAVRAFDDLAGGMVDKADGERAVVGGFRKATLPRLSGQLLRVDDARMLLAIVLA